MRLMEIAARLLMAGTTRLHLWIAHRHVAARGSVLVILPSPACFLSFLIA